MRLQKEVASKLCTVMGMGLCRYIQYGVLVDLEYAAGTIVSPHELSQMRNWLEQLVQDIEAGNLPEVGVGGK
jgi:hypothetical protein